MSDTEPTIYCPSCGSDKVIKVSVAHENESSSQKEELSPPRRPELPGAHSFNNEAYESLPLRAKAILILSFSLVFLAVLPLNSLAVKIFPESSIPQLILGLLMVGVWIIIYLRLLKPYRERLAKEYESNQPGIWQNAMDKWQKLYYCERDDLVFDPEDQGAYVLARDMQSLING
jgi:hypothetical protein